MESDGGMSLITGHPVIQTLRRKPMALASLVHREHLLSRTGRTNVSSRPCGSTVTIGRACNMTVELPALAHARA